jgi:hypothetical protein
MEIDILYKRQDDSFLQGVLVLEDDHFKVRRDAAPFFVSPVEFRLAFFACLFCFLLSNI